MKQKVQLYMTFAQFIFKTKKNLFSVQFAHTNSLSFIMLCPKSTCQPFLWEIHHFTNESKVIALKVFLFGSILFPVVHAQLACQFYWNFMEIILFPSQMVECEIYFMKNGTKVDDIITISFFVPQGMLNAISLTSVTCGLSHHWQISQCVQYWVSSSNEAYTYLH